MFSIDSLWNDFVEQFTGPVTVDMIVISLLVAFAGAVFIVMIYKKTFTGIVYNRTTALTLILLAMVTAMIIRTINSNLSLSLGMVGALSIVRFRTAIKEPVDTAFMFWAITVGIMSGAGLYIITIVGCLLLGLFYYLSFTYVSKASAKYLMVIIFTDGAEKSIQKALEKIKDKKLKSKSTTVKTKRLKTSKTTPSNDTCELTYEVVYDKNTEAVMKEIQEIPGVTSINLVTYTNEFGL
ncbi:MAG: DUF4956 domain-containing protein [Erysipelotrichaceae bacterium]|nr:DUF4956 domain-containing protein [Erysipelotrichaceae bacterium]